MLVLLHEEGVAVTPLNVSVLSFCWLPKLVPVIVTEVPTVPAAGDIRVMTGITRNDCELLAVPPTFTMTSANPAERLDGTGTTTFVLLHEPGEAVTPPKVTKLVPCVAPNPVPLIVTGLPTGATGPTVGERLVMCGWLKQKLALNVRTRKAPRSDAQMAFIFFPFPVRRIHRGLLEPNQL
jgi:hypothetical protein